MGFWIRIIYFLKWNEYHVVLLKEKKCFILKQVRSDKFLTFWCTCLLKTIIVLTINDCSGSKLSAVTTNKGEIMKDRIIYDGTQLISPKNNKLYFKIDQCPISASFLKIHIWSRVLNNYFYKIHNTILTKNRFLP